MRNPFRGRVPDDPTDPGTPERGRRIKSHRREAGRIRRAVQAREDANRRAEYIRGKDWNR